MKWDLTPSHASIVCLTVLLQKSAKPGANPSVHDFMTWKNFYSVSGFWRISSEEFMKDFTWLSDLKVRYNYGKTGSVTGIDNYERYALIKTGGNYFRCEPNIAYFFVDRRYSFRPTYLGND